MNDEFKIDNAKIERISSAFNIEKRLVESLYSAYRDFSTSLQGQFLAHAMRGIECYFRKKMKNNRFIVICEPYKKFSPGQKQASSYYYHPRSAVRSYDKQNSSFIINYNKDLPERELRDYISHEIGHLFWLAISDIKDLDIGDRTEPLSSIFGIFTMSEKNDFYTNYDISLRNHTNWQELLDYFLNNVQ